ncbi:response regulator [Paenibacillus sp. FSL M7-1046]|uniref:response regulator n=1 Tax=Paenibacillus sp. FSL M7-1046 TaxID=2975315 RepID=UPI0030F5CF8B
MLRIVLLDDEKPALNVLNKVIGGRDDVQVVGAYMDPSELLKDIKGLRPDLVFLDIEMPEMNGLELAARLLELQEDIEVVFVTAYREYALEAFGVNALDYLLKPVVPDLLHRTIDRVLKRRTGTAPAKAATAASRIVCFGGFEIYKADHAEPIRFPTAKAEELFAYLLVHRNKYISKWTLCDSLWPEVHSAEKSDHNLHTAVYRMKKTLRDTGIGVRISSQRGSYRMECEDICDYVMFEQAVTHTLKMDNGNIEALTKAVQLYKGSLFGNRDYPWCEAERERMSRYFASLSKKLAKLHLEKRQYHEAVEVLQSVLSYVPFDGEAHEILLRTYIHLHDRTAFFAHYEKMEKSFKGELGVELPEVLRQLYADLL